MVVIFLLDLPPPVHGMSEINRRILALKYTNGDSVLNTCPSGKSAHFHKKRWIFYRSVKIILVVSELLRLLVCRPQPVYRPISGGLGQCYEIIFAIVTRIFATEIFIHHHSYAYLNKFSPLFFVLNFLLGKKSLHIVLSPKMKVDLCNLYKINPEVVKCVSNICVLDSDGSGETDVSGQLVLGHLSNLSEDKGLFEYLEIVKRLSEKGVKFRAYLAGPFPNRVVEKLVTEYVNSFDGFVYLGPLYGEKKDKFFSSLDVFIFPTKYKNEAEPLVLYEAARFGALLMSTRLGCIGEILDGFEGYSIGQGECAIEKVLNHLQLASEDLEGFRLCKEQRVNLYKNRLKENEVSINYLF